VTLIDTSAWIEYLRRTGSQANLRVRSLLDRQDPIATCDVVVLELLAGARSDVHHAELRALLNRAHHLAVRPLFDYEEAARIYLSCRREGVTPRSLTDCLVAAVALHTGTPLLHADSDFNRMAEIVGLEVA
jgi:hypothetical protein